MPWYIWLARIGVTLFLWRVMLRSYRVTQEYFMLGWSLGDPGLLKAVATCSVLLPTVYTLLIILLWNW
jgi:hypothetical protein